MVIDPHTAVGLEASSKYLSENPNDIVVTLATAHPSKFSKSVNSILGFDPNLPFGYKNIFNLKENYQVIDNSYNLVKNFILQNANNI
jgi:threonine synthase